MIEKDTPDLILNYPRGFPDELIEKELQLFESNKVKVNKVEPQIFLASEWVIPTIFSAIFLKSYFDAFFSEAGKDHYNLLKLGLKKLIEKGKLIKAKFEASKLSPDKLSKDYNQSVVISIEVITKNNKRIKLLFDNELTQEDWENAIEQLIDIIAENYKNHPNDNLTKKFNKNINPANQYVYAVIDKKTKKVNFYDDRGMSELNNK